MEIKFEPKKDCFAWDRTNNRCKCLRETVCKNGKCNFYKKKGTLCVGCPIKGTASCVDCKGARTGL